MTLTIDTDIQYLRGVGEKRAALYRKLGVHSVRDLLYLFPRDYLDLSAPASIASAPLHETCAVRARLIRKSGEQRIRKGLSVFRLLAADDTGDLVITLFNVKYTVEQLKLNTDYIFYGKMSGSLLRREMASPAIYPADGQPSILPVYPQTAGIHSRLIRKNIAQILEELPPQFDPLTKEIREAYALPGWRESMNAIHFPGAPKEAVRARERFIFEELLTLCCALSLLRAGRVVQSAPPMQYHDPEDFYRSLPFAPTDAQRRVIAECCGDMCGDTPMNRLVQGDVGSGKTLVAAACISLACQNGFQAVLMAPTGILAEQHEATMRTLLRDSGVRIALLTGATPAAEKRKIRAALESGDIDLCIGTHALLSEGVHFHSPGLIVTDEQHRFGVEQRAHLSGRYTGAHVLVMSATPIPRTLSLIIYGDLQLSVIDELPPGRRKIDTYVIGSAKRGRALGFVRKALDEGRQAYIVCPLIEAGEEETELRPAREYAERLSREELYGYSVALLHGKMKPAEKESVMRAFSRGEIQALVSTTVVEVGVDVPNAVIMLVENAERFGLSQLHQLRGRVGRGEHPSTCILISDAKGETARSRLRMMKETTDGFRLAEYDLKARGPGDFFGRRQHGLPTLHVASLSDDMNRLEQARECAARLAEKDPDLTGPFRRIGDLARVMIGSIGERPN